MTYLKWVVGGNPMSTGRLPPPRVHLGNYNLLAFFSATSEGIPRIKEIESSFHPRMYSLPSVVAKAFWKIFLCTSSTGVSCRKPESNNQDWVATAETKRNAFDPQLSRKPTEGVGDFTQNYGAVSIWCVCICKYFGNNFGNNIFWKPFFSFFPPHPHL